MSTPCPVLMGVEEGYFVGCSAAIEGEHAGGPYHGLTEQLRWTGQPSINPESEGDWG